MIALGRIVLLGVALPLAGAIAFVMPLTARAADQNAPIANTDTRDASSEHVDAQIARLQEELHITNVQVQQMERAHRGDAEKCAADSIEPRGRRQNPSEQCDR
jgi:hypothetical protein